MAIEKITRAVDDLHAAREVLKELIWEYITRSCTMKVPDGVDMGTLDKSDLFASHRLLDYVAHCYENLYKRKNIIELTHIAVSYYAATTGVMPTVVYLGEDEVREVTEIFHNNTSAIVRESKRNNEVNGLRIIEVKEVSYFAVG